MKHNAANRNALKTTPQLVTGYELKNKTISHSYPSQYGYHYRSQNKKNMYKIHTENRTKIILQKKNLNFF